MLRTRLTFCRILRLTGLPKDITLDGELWMKRGTFDQTSQICRTTVRLGRLRTFSHFLDRDSMERQWLREQVGGRIASQDRLRAERSALSLLCSSVRARRAAEHATPARSSAASSSWKAWKRSVLKSATSDGHAKPKIRSRSAPRSSVASSFLRSLFGRSIGRSGSTLLVERTKPRRLLTKRCPRCGKVVRRMAISSKNPSGNVETGERANADQRLSEPLLPPSAPATSIPPHDATTGTTLTSSRRPHAYTMLDASHSGTSRRTIPSTYTHVCRRKSKSSNEWHQIKFMVSPPGQTLARRILST